MIGYGTLLWRMAPSPHGPYWQEGMKLGYQDAGSWTLLKSTPLIDGHNDLPWEIREFKTAPRDVAAYDLRGRTPKHTDLGRLKEGQVAAQFWSIYIPGEIKDSGFARVQLEQFDIARRMIARYPDRLALDQHLARPVAASRMTRTDSTVPALLKSS